MRWAFPVPVREILPTRESLLRSQGIPADAPSDLRRVRLADEALALYAERARPMGLLAVLDADRFPAICFGEGLNHDESPVGPISRAADHLALFAVTSGEPVTGEIARRFAERDFALGLLLDSAASLGTERIAGVIEDLFRRHLANGGRLPAGTGIMRFSPGYCGWHVTAQRRLFEALDPGEIGITLNDSCLMRPLKSVSGVLIAGERGIFIFDDVFSFCGECATHECRERITAMLGR